MGIIKLSCLTLGALGVAMLHFGRDDGLPVDRIGREPTIAQDTIVPVSAALDPGIAGSPETAEGEIIATANATPAVQAPKAAAPARLVAVPVTLASASTPQTPAELAEAQARKMASNITTATPAAASLTTDAFPTVFVSGTTVNMRAGPSTKHGVVAKLTYGTEVYDMGTTASGWSQIKVVDTGARGFMATRFLVSQL
ncbi:hypothetical protein MUY21_13735 [Aliiroseovarius sp. S2029]|uniref:SH3 domain-containing protein n=1 Tax=Aliiroseovarius sp. S2029 TaxID=2936988 RepID=UPI0020BD768D|nr:SH3 domain-containing protein [Aliiroseovarius sp. S2029]MCK8485101.1 hypothetical protein [Aliiroseovarius sp. S2029]